MLSKVLLLRDNDEDELAYSESEQATADASASASSYNSAFAAVSTLLTQWRAKLSTELRPLPRDAQNVHSPLFRCLDREVTTGVKLLQHLHTDIQAALAVCAGDAKLTNHIRAMLNDMSKGM